MIIGFDGFLDRLSHAVGIDREGTAHTPTSVIQAPSTVHSRLVLTRHLRAEGATHILFSSNREGGNHRDHRSRPTPRSAKSDAWKRLGNSLPGDGAVGADPIWRELDSYFAWYSVLPAALESPISP